MFGVVGIIVFDALSGLTFAACPTLVGMLRFYLAYASRVIPYTPRDDSDRAKEMATDN